MAADDPAAVLVAAALLAVVPTVAVAAVGKVAAAVMAAAASREEEVEAARLRCTQGRCPPSAQSLGSLQSRCRRARGRSPGELPGEKHPDLINNC